MHGCRRGPCSTDGRSEVRGDPLTGKLNVTPVLTRDEMREIPRKNEACNQTGHEYGEGEESCQECR